MIRYTMLFAFLVIGPVVAMAEDPKPETPSSLTLTNSTVAVAEIDLTKIDCDELQRWISQAQFEGATEQDIKSLFTEVKQQLDELRNSGTDRIYLSWRTNDLLNGIPLVQARTKNPKALKQVFSKCWKFFLGNLAGDMKVESGWATMGRVADAKHATANSSKTTERFDVALAKRGLDHQLVINLPPESRDDLIALWPETLTAKSLPITISPTQLVRDIDVIDVQWTMPPQTALTITFTATSDAARNRLAELANSMIQSNDQWKALMSVSTDQHSVVIDFNERPTASISSLLLKEISAQVNRVHRAGQSLQTMNKLKQIGVGLHRYVAKYGHFPSPAMKNADGDEVLSWRVAIAPFIEQRALYNAIDKQQAWDSAANELFTQTIIPTFRTPGVAGAKTAIRLPAIEGSMWDGTHEKPKFQEITDGTSNTIAVAIAPDDQAVPWTKPEVWQLDENDLIGSFFGDRDEVIVLSFDGAAHAIKKADMTNEKLRRLLTIAGGEVSDW